MAKDKKGVTEGMFEGALRVVSTRDGFWRGGVRHSANEVTHPPGTFTVEQAEAILAEPMLVARELTADEWKAHQAANTGAAA